MDQDLWDWKTVLSYVIKYGNYDFFKEIMCITLNPKISYSDLIMDLTVFNKWWNIYSRLQILDELLKSWFQIKFLDVVNIIKCSDAIFKIDMRISL